ncbi:MAG: TetR/AcrR family transcriptional regulator [Spirochaetales bacterium]|nr:TetR/AcrR family transcriptional regulator [Spirochaetales bacterium]MCF7937723.1 TetR/AcrR family transcriptional regulator [Spirochaetales bacterium]
MERNRERTAEKFIDAVHDLLMDGGYETLGVNAIAEKAGANKVLIYRYFGGLEELLQEYVNRMDPFPDLIDRIEKELEKKSRLTVDEVSRIIFSRLEKMIRDNRALAELLKWEIVSSNPLTRKIAESREQNGRRLTRYLKEHFPRQESKDIEAVLAILTGGLFYLWLRGDTINEFNGVPLGKPSGRKRLLEAATDIVRTVFSDRSE